MTIYLSYFEFLLVHENKVLYFQNYFSPLSAWAPSSWCSPCWDTWPLMKGFPVWQSCQEKVDFQAEFHCLQDICDLHLYNAEKQGKIFQYYQQISKHLIKNIFIPARHKWPNNYTVRRSFKTIVFMWQWPENMKRISEKLKTQFHWRWHDWGCSTSQTQTHFTCTNAILSTLETNLRNM